MSLTTTLKEARAACRLSQLELALRMGVSQRHVSWVETGRARPSRALLQAWLRELDAPLALRNEALLQAGYAPLYAQTPLDDRTLEPAQQALSQLLAAHDPLPAMVLDAHWDLLQLNRGAHWLATTLMPWLKDPPTQSQARLNLLDLLGHPEGLLAQTTNLDEVAPGLVAQLRSEARTDPVLSARVDRLIESLRQRLGAKALLGAPRLLPPVLTTRLHSPFGPLAFFSLFTTFGSPQHITLASLRVEHLCAADAQTRMVLEREVGRG